MAATVAQAFDYKYADREWKSESAETFRLAREITASYTSLTGLTSRIREETKEFASAPAIPPEDPLTYPPYFYADGSWHRDAAYSFQATLIKTTDYQAQGPDSFVTTVTTLNPLTGETSTETTITSGSLPRIPTVNTALTSLVVQPIIATLTDECLDDFVESKKSLKFEWVETVEQLENAARRQMQRDSAIIRTIRLAANPLIQIGHTVRLVDPKRSIDALHLVTGRSITRDCETGDCTMTLTLEYWVR